METTAHTSSPNSHRLPASLEGASQKEIIKWLLHRNEELEKEVGSMKESVLVESMNDMRDHYREMVRENMDLKNKLKKFEDDPAQGNITQLKRKLVIYSNIVRKMKRLSARVIVANELVERTVTNLADEDGEIQCTELHLDGMFSVSRTATDALDSYIGHEILHDEMCAEDICDSCFRCRHITEDDPITISD